MSTLPLNPLDKATLKCLLDNSLDKVSLAKGQAAKWVQNNSQYLHLIVEDKASRAIEAMHRLWAARKARKISI